MANMSYCRFRNTLSDLLDCYYAMEDDAEMDKLPEDEASARDALIELCTRIVNEYTDS